MAKVNYVIEVPIRGTRPGIGAAVAMVAASEQRWIVWARGDPFEMEGYEDMDWEAEAELCSRSEAMRTMAAMAAESEELHARYEWQVRREWQVLPEGMEP